MIFSTLLFLGVVSALPGQGTSTPAKNALDRYVSSQADPRLSPPFNPRPVKKKEKKALTSFFPHLFDVAAGKKPPFVVHVLGDQTEAYNCLAYALGIKDKWMYPEDDGVKIEMETVSNDGRITKHSFVYATVEGMVIRMAKHGYIPCKEDEADIDVYGRDELRVDGTVVFEPKHVARSYGSRDYAQSKLGPSYLISHPRRGLEDPGPEARYGLIYAHFRLDPSWSDPQAAIDARPASASASALASASTRRLTEEPLKVSKYID